jgi:hypothetical protein
MRSLCLALASPLALLALLALAGAAACGPPKQPASVLADDTVEPSNKDDIQRYKDEFPVQEKQYIEWKAAPVRRGNPDGELVALLMRGNPVSKISKRGDFFLITFPNPDDPGKRWMGWVHKKVFEPGTEPFPPLGNPQRCQADGDCNVNAICHGVASAGPSGLDGFRFCTGKPVPGKP